MYDRILPHNPYCVTREQSMIFMKSTTGKLTILYCGDNMKMNFGNTQTSKEANDNAIKCLIASEVLFQV